MDKILGIVVLGLLLSVNAYADLGGLGALMNWNHLKIKCHLNDPRKELRKYEIKITEKKIIQKKWDNYGWHDNFQIVKATDDTVFGTKKRIDDTSAIDYVLIDRNNSIIQHGWYIINLKNEKVFFKSYDGHCTKDLN